MMNSSHLRRLQHGRQARLHGDAEPVRRQLQQLHHAGQDLHPSRLQEHQRNLCEFFFSLSILLSLSLLITSPSPLNPMLTLSTSAYLPRPATTTTTRSRSPASWSRNTLRTSATTAAPSATPSPRASRGCCGATRTGTSGSPTPTATTPPTRTIRALRLTRISGAPMALARTSKVLFFSLGTASLCVHFVG